jgi:hypothetical protein
MKRPATLSLVGITNSLFLSNFTLMQFALIGAATIAYNECEGVLHSIAGTVVGYPGNPMEVTARINGTDGLVAIIADGCSHIPSITAEVHKAIRATLQGEGFSLLKTYRDAVIHATPYNIHIHIGRTPGKRGAVNEVLLSEPALNWLVSQLGLLNEEMKQLRSTVIYAERLRRPTDTGEHKERLEEALRVATAQFLEAQNARLAVRKPPQFPEIPDDLVIRTTPLEGTTPGSE